MKLYRIYNEYLANKNPKDYEGYLEYKNHKTNKIRDYRKVKKKEHMLAKGQCPWCGFLLASDYHSTYPCNSYALSRATQATLGTVGIKFFYTKIDIYPHNLDYYG